MAFVIPRFARRPAPAKRSLPRPPAPSVAKPVKVVPVAPAPAPIPHYTPGGMGANSLQQLAALRLKHSLATGENELGQSLGAPGTIEQQRLLRIADINAGRIKAGQGRDENYQTTDRNYAARGLGRGGLYAVDRGKVGADYLDAIGSYDRSASQAELDARNALNQENFDFASGSAGLKAAGAAEDYQNWLEANPNPGAAAEPAPVAAAGPAKPDWNTWVRLHPWAKTTAQKALLRKNYDAM